MRGLKRWLAVGLLLVTLPVAGGVEPAWGQSPGQLQQLARMETQYNNLRAQARWDDAATTAERMIEYARANRFPAAYGLDAIGKLALARMAQGRYAEAQKQYERVLREGLELRIQDAQLRSGFRGTLFNAYLGMGRSSIYLGDQRGAIEWMRQAVAYADRNGLDGQGAQVRTDLGRLLAETGQEEEGIAMLKEAIGTLRRIANPHPTFLPAALHALGQTYDGIGRYDLGEPYHRQSVDQIVRVVGWNHNFTADFMHSLASSYHIQGRDAEAERLYAQVVAIYENTVGRRHPDTAVALNNLARLLQYRDDEDERAEALAREALDIKREFIGGNHPDAAVSMVNLAGILWNQQRYGEAERLVRRALAVYREFGVGGYQLTDGLQVLATILGDQGDAAGGLDVLDEAIAITELSPLEPSRIAWLRNSRAIALFQLDRHEAAAEEMEKCIAMLDVARTYASGVEQERAGLVAYNAVFYEGAIRFQAAVDDPEAMFAVSEMMKARSLLDELQFHDVDLLTGLSDTARARIAAAEAQLRRALTEAHARYDALPELGLDPTEGALERHRKAAGAIAAARDALADHLAEVKSLSPTYRNLITRQADTATLEALQQTMVGDELALAYLIGGDHSYVIAIGQDEVRFAELVLDEAEAGRFGVDPGPVTRRRLQRILMSEGGVLPAMSSPEALPTGFHEKLATLFEVLIPEDVRQPLAAGEITRLTVLPSAGLAMLPFEALVTSIEDGEPTYLLDVGPPITYAPSATVLLNLVERPDANVAQSVLTLGDPAYATSTNDQDAVGRVMASVGAENQFRAGLARLPFSGWEAEWVQDHFEGAGLKTTRLSGRDATESALREAAAGQSIVHLACHGMADKTHSNLFGALALAPGRASDPADDGFLNMSEIYDLPLDGCELAILSACETNYGPQQTGEGVWALSRGFLVAGARRVVASNWVVDDRAGATLVSYLASYLVKQDGEGEGTTHDYASALHKAKQLVRKNAEWQHPFYWSSLVLVGPR